MTPFFQVSPGSAGAMYRCSSSSVPTSMALVMGSPGCSSTSSSHPQPRLTPFWFLPCFIAALVWPKVYGLYALLPISWISNGSVEKSCKALFIHSPVSVKPRFQGGWGGDRPQQELYAQLGSLDAHLPSLGITRFSQTTKMCAINERLWPTSYSFIVFGLVYMGKLHQFSLSLFLKWFD